MKFHWYWPTLRENLLSGDFYIADTPNAYGGVRDKKNNWGVLHVEFDASDALSPEQRKEFMESLLLVAEIKWNELKEKNETTV